ncbi:MAG: hypothetical protein WAO35_23080 [Terriglobia bacterium]
MNHEKRIRRAERILFRDDDGGFTWEEIQEIFLAGDPEKFKQQALESHNSGMLRMLDQPPPPNIGRLIAQYNRIQKAYEMTVAKTKEEKA